MYTKYHIGRIIYTKYHHPLLSKNTTCRIDEHTKNRIKFATKCMKIRNDELDAFYSEQYVVGNLLTNYFKSIGINEEIESDISESKIKSSESFLRRYRIDTNLPENMKDDLKALSDALLKEKMVDRKLSYHDIVNMMLKKYLEDYPKLKEHLLEFRYIKSQMGLKELQDQKEKERYGID